MNLLKRIYFLVVFVIIVELLSAQPHPGYNGNGDPVGGDPVGGGAPLGGMLAPMLIFAAVVGVYKAMKKPKKEKSV